MKVVQRSFNKIIALILMVSMLIASIPLMSWSISANNDNSIESDSPWNYAIYSDSSDEPFCVKTTEGNFTLNGNIHINGNLQFSGGTWNQNNSVVEVVGISNVSGEGDFVQTNAIQNTLNDIYVDLKIQAGPNAVIYDRSYSFNESEIEISNSVISKNQLEIIADSLVDGKMGGFGAGFITEMYENPDIWENVIPAFNQYKDVSADSAGQYDLLDLGNKSKFIPVQEMAVNGNWKNYNKLPDQIFMQNYNSDSNYIIGYTSNLANNSSAKTACSEGEITNITAAWDNSTYNPSDANSASKMHVNGGKFTLCGDYNELTEIRFDTNSSAQLIGDFPNLRKIYMTTYSNLNLAGNFPALESVYMPGGQLLLGTDIIGFNAEDVNIVNENGPITIFTSDDINIIDSSIATNAKIAIRGSGKDAVASKFIAKGSVFAAGNTITLGDMNDSVTTRFSEVPVFFAQAGLSIVNCNFQMLQGAFTNRDGKMIFSSSNIDLFRGFLFSQQGIDDKNFNSTQAAYVEGNEFIFNPGLGNEDYTAYGYALGHIESMEVTTLPKKYMVMGGAERFISQIRNANDKTNYYIVGSTTPDVAKITLSSYILSEDNMYLFSDELNTLSDRKTVIASHNGDVRINAQTAIINGIIYAPNGKVIINSDNFTLNGKIVANSIEFVGKNFIINDDDSIYSLIQPLFEISADGLRSNLNSDTIGFTKEVGTDTYLTDMNGYLVCSVDTKNSISSVEYTVKNDLEVKSGTTSANNGKILIDYFLKHGLNVIDLTIKDNSGYVLTKKFSIYSTEIQEQFTSYREENDFEEDKISINDIPEIPDEPIPENYSVILSGGTVIDADTAYVGENILVQGDLTVSSMLILGNTSIKVNGNLTVLNNGEIFSIPNNLVLNDNHDIEIFPDQDDLLDANFNVTGNVFDHGRISINYLKSFSANNVTVFNDAYFGLTGGINNNISGNLIASGAFKVGGGAVTVGGDVRVQKELENGDFGETDGYISISTSGNLIVKGDYYTQSTADYYYGINDSCLELHGNLTQYGTNTNFYAMRYLYAYDRPNVKIVFAGDNDHNISFDRYDRYATLEYIEIKGNGKLNFLTPVFNVNLLSQATLTGNTVQVGSFNTNGYLTKVEGNLSIDSAIIKGDLEVEGDFTTSDNVYIEEKSNVTVVGNVSINGSLTVADSSMFVIDKDIDVNENGSLVVFDPESKISVKGKYITNSKGYDYNGTGLGVFEIGGDFSQIGGKFYQGFSEDYSGDSKIIFKGENVQTISFATQNSQSTLGNMLVYNDVNQVIFATPIYSVNLLGNSAIKGDTVRITSLNTNNYTIDIDGDFFADSLKADGRLNVSGDFQLTGIGSVDGRISIETNSFINGSLHLDNGRIDVQGDTYIQAGRLFTEGKYFSSGDFNVMMVENGEPAPTRGSIYLYSSNSNLTVKGNFNTFSSAYSYYQYHSGILQLYGDFTQIGADGVFKPSGQEFKIVFAGNNEQKVSFDRVDEYGDLGNVYKSTTKGSVKLLTDIYSFTPQSDLVFSGEAHIISPVNLAGMIVKFIDNVEFDGAVNLAGGVLKGEKNLIFNSGDIDVTDSMFVNNTDSGNIYFNGDSRIIMSKQSSVITANNIYYNSTSGTSISEGLIDIKGNYKQTTPVVFECTSDKAFVQFSSLNCQMIDVPSEKYIKFYYIGINAINSYLDKNPETEINTENFDNVLNMPTLTWYLDDETNTNKTTVFKGFTKNCVSIEEVTDKIDVRHFGTSGVHAPTGNYSQSFTGLSIPTKIGTINISHTYNSLNDESDILGKGFTFSYGMKIESETVERGLVTENYKYVTLATGSRWTFIEKNGIWEPQNTYANLESWGNGWVLTTTDQTRYYFNAAGEIQKISDRNDNAILITVTNDKITKIEDEGNHTGRAVINFEYNEDGLLTKVTDASNSLSTQYFYDDKNRLKSYIDSAGQKIEYDYTDDNSINSDKISTIKDYPNGLSGNSQDLQSIQYFSDGDNEGKVSTVAFLDGIVSTYDYNYEVDAVKIIDTAPNAQTRYVIQRYDSSGSIYEVENDNGDIESTNYLLTNGQNMFGLVRTTTDITGNITTYDYDEKGNVTKITYPDGSFETNEYDDYNNPIVHTNTIGVKTYFKYSADGKRLESAAMPLDGISNYFSPDADLDKFEITRYEYYPDNFYPINGLLKKTYSPSGDEKNYTQYEYNNKGQITKQTVYIDGISYSAITSYNSYNMPDYTIDPNGTEIDYAYSSTGQLLKTTVWDYEGDKKSVSRIVYDQLNRPIQTIAPEIYKQSEDSINEVKHSSGNYVQRYYSDATYADSNAGALCEYNAKRQLRSETDALKNTTTYSYDVWGNVSTITLPNGAISEMEYDRLKRVIAKYYRENTYSSAKLLNEYQYINVGSDTKTVTKAYLDDVGSNGARLSTSSVITDWADRVIEYKNNDGNISTAEYSKGGLLKSQTSITGSTVYYNYDNLGRVISTYSRFEAMENAAVTYTYDRHGNVITTSQRSGAIGGTEQTNTVDYTYDAWNRLVMMIAHPNSSESNYIQNYYDWSGKLVKQYKGLHSPLTIAADGTVTPGEDKDYSVYSYEYDYLGNPTKATDALGQYETFTYNLNGQIETVVDRNNAGHTFEYNANGQITQQISGTGNDQITKEYTYNSLGLVSTATQSIAASQSSQTISYSYNPNGTLATETDGSIVKSFTYDNTGIVKSYSITDDENVLQSIENLYDSSERLTEVKENGSAVAQYSYDRTGRLVKTTKLNGSKVVGTENITYNQAGLVKSIINKQGNTTTSQFEYTYYLNGNQRTKKDKTGTTIYYYDGMNRLIKAVMSNGVTQEYQFDDNSNRTKLTESANGNIVKKVTYVYDKNDRLISETTEEWSDSEMTQWNTETVNYTYDANGNMLSKGDTVTQQFDVLNRMTAYNGNGHTATYTYGINDLRISKTIDNVTTNQIWVASNIAIDESNENMVSYVWGLKLIKSNYGYYDFDAHGNVVSVGEFNYDYDPYGNLISGGDDSNPFRYSGEYTDFESGYVYLRARYYDSDTGRFVSVDPISNGLNWYSYCEGNPINLIDPSGLAAESVPMNLITAAPEGHKLPTGYELSKLKQREYQSRPTISSDEECMALVTLHWRQRWEPDYWYGKDEGYDRDGYKIVEPEQPENPEIPQEPEEPIVEISNEMQMDYDMQDQIFALLKDKYSRDKWENAQYDERKKMLQDLLRDCNSIMGTNVDENITFKPLGGKFGSYYWGSYTIEINDNLISEPGQYESLVLTIVHEVRHAYQRETIDGFHTVDESTRNAWANNDPRKDGQYISLSADKANYYIQPLEYDAYCFAGQINHIKPNPVYSGSWNNNRVQYINEVHP